MKKTTLGAAVALIISAVMTTPASAINSLQLGPDGSSDWTYVGGGDDTWYYNGTQPFTLNAYANALKVEGGNGDYAWATEPDTNRYAYLVAATVPDLGSGDKFDLTFLSNNASFVTSGWGTAPVEDTNSLSPHGIFDTYFEIYEFQFDGGIVDISDTQPGQTGTGKGYNEAFSISWTDLTNGSVTGVHFDLFTVTSGRYTPGGSPDNKLVQAFAPNSHDAQSIPPGEDPPSAIPEPSILALFGLSLFGLGLLRRRQKNG